MRVLILEIFGRFVLECPSGDFGEIMIPYQVSELTVSSCMVCIFMLPALQQNLN